MKRLIIVPHPDDEVLAFGGSISKWINNGDKIWVDIAAMKAHKGQDVQFKEFFKVCEFLGVEGKLLNCPLIENYRNSVKI